MKQSLYVLLDEPSDPSVNTQVLSHYYTSSQAAVRAAHSELMAVANDYAKHDPGFNIELVEEEYETSAGHRNSETIGYALFSSNYELIESITAQHVSPANN